MIGSLDGETDLVAVDLDDDDLNLAVDHDLLVQLARKDEHGYQLLVREHEV
jgi:hypothetical protein